MRNNALVVASIGGVSYEAGGADVVVNQFLEAYDTVKHTYPFLDQCDLHIVGVDMSKHSLDYRSDVFNTAKRAGTTNGGDVTLVALRGIPFSGFRNVYGSATDIERRHSLCASFATAIERIAAGYDRIVIVAHGDILVSLPEILTSSPYRRNMSVLWVPHVLSQTYEHPYEVRFQAELKGLSRFAENDRVVAVAPSIFNLLRSTYGLEPNRVVPCFNEIYPSSRKYYLSTAKSRLPVDPFALFCGRMNHAKGGHLVVDYYLKCATEELPTLLFISPLDGNGGAYEQQVRADIEKINTIRPGLVELIDHYDAELLSAAIRSDYLVLIFMPSATELRSILSLEYVSLRRDGVPIVYNNIEPLRSVFAEFPETFAFEGANPESLSCAIAVARDRKRARRPVVGDSASDRYQKSFASLMQCARSFMGEQDDTELFSGPGRQG